MTLWQLDPATGQTSHDLINTGTVVRDYTCMTFSKNKEDILFAGSESGDLLAFQVKNKSLAFNINACAKGISTIRAVSAEKVVVGGGDGQVLLFSTANNQP
jgi:hypothetical protein